MARAADARAVRGDARARHRAAGELRAPAREAAAAPFACVGCGAPLFEGGGEVRERHRLAELQRAGRGRGRDHHRPQLGHDAGPRCIARPAAATSGTSSRTGRRRPACATASTAWRWSSGRPDAIASLRAVPAPAWHPAQAPRRRRSARSQPLDDNPNRLADDGAVPGDQGAASRCAAVLPDGRLLRDVLRRRRGGERRARHRADQARPASRRRTSRCAACRCTPPRATC